jgi:hypothetical protein
VAVKVGLKVLDRLKVQLHVVRGTVVMALVVDTSVHLTVDLEDKPLGEGSSGCVHAAEGSDEVRAP